MPPDKWIKLILRNNWQDKVSGKVKVYPLGLKDRKVINEKFNELY